MLILSPCVCIHVVFVSHLHICIIELRGVCLCLCLCSISGFATAVVFSMILYVCDSFQHDFISFGSSGNRLFQVEVMEIDL